MIKRKANANSSSSNNSTLLTSKKALKVRHVDEFKQNLLKASHAAIGVIVIPTREAYRAASVIHDWAIENQKEYRFWTSLTGWQQFQRPVPFLDDDGDEQILDQKTPSVAKDPVTMPVLNALELLHNEEGLCPEDGVYVCMGAHPYFENPAVQQFIKSHVQYSLLKRKTLVLIIPDYVTLPQDIQDDIHIIDFKVPSHAELLDEVWSPIIEHLDEKQQPGFSKKDVNLIIQNATGMTAYEFDVALALALVEFTPQLEKDPDQITPEHFIDFIRRNKVELIKKTDILELMPTSKMEEVGGLDLLKEWIALRSKSFSDEARSYGVDQPKGILVAGPPGCGKSLIAKAVSATLHVPCIRLDIGRVFGKYVGESEERMRRAINQVESMAPCILFIDEVDKGLGGLTNDNTSGTTSRVFGSLLTWLQERNSEESPIFIIMTANKVTALPPELMRKGRLDEIFCVSFPSREERKTILKIHVEKRGHKLEDADYERIAEKTKFFVGAELEAIVKEAMIRSFNDGLKTVSANYIIEEAERIVPISKAFKREITEMSEWAKNNARPASRQDEDMQIVAKKPKNAIMRSGGHLPRKPVFKG